MTLDRTLSYRERLAKTAGKLGGRNNLLMGLAGSTWGAGADALRSSALALCYSAAECCAPVWSGRVGHAGRVDVQLGSAMRLISGALRFAPLPWLPVLSGIGPPALRGKAAHDGLVERVIGHGGWPVRPGPDILGPPLLRLASRRPLWLDLRPVDIRGRWGHGWRSAQVVISLLVCGPTVRRSGFGLPRRQWSAEPFSHGTGTLRCL